MPSPVAMTEIWRGDFLESTHMGHAVFCHASGDILKAWGDPECVVLPRSSVKMLQALPLIESGAADAANLPMRNATRRSLATKPDQRPTGGGRSNVYLWQFIVRL